MYPPDLGTMQVAARPVVKTKRTDQLTYDVGRTKIPPDFVSFMSRGAKKKRSKRNLVPSVLKPQKKMHLFSIYISKISFSTVISIYKLAKKICMKTVNYI